MKDLAEVYETLTEQTRHSTYLDAAVRAARQTLPTLEPDGNVIAESQMPHSHKGAKAIRSLGDSLFDLMLPQGIRWGKIDLSPENWALIEKGVKGKDGREAGGPQVKEQMQERFEKRSTDIQDSLGQKLMRSRGTRAMHRIVVEGQGVGIVQRPGMRLFPLRSFRLLRDRGNPWILGLEETVAPSPTDEEQGEEKKYYTVVRYPQHDPMTQMPLDADDGDVGVWKQESNQEGEKGKPVKQDGKDGRPFEHYSQYFVFSTALPETEDYIYSYAYEFLRLFANINHASKSLGSAMTLAAYSRLFLKPGSSAASRWKEFRDGGSTQPWVGDPTDAQWSAVGTKMNEWSWVAHQEDRWNRDIDDSFGGGIRERPAGGDSATAVLEIVEEVARHVEGLHSTLQETFQRAMFIAEMQLFEQIDPLFGPFEFPTDVMNLIKVEISTGTSVKAKQSSMLRYALQLLPVIQQMDPLRFVVNGGPIADEAGKAVPGVATEGLYSWSEEFPQLPPAEGGGAAPQETDADREQAFMTAGGPQRTGNPQPAAGAV